MAGFNPFRKFRKYQRPAMAALGIMAMICFVFLGIVPRMMEDQQSVGPEIIAKTRRYGEITPYLVQELRNNRQILGRFFQLLLQNVAADGRATQDQQTGIFTHKASQQSLLPLQQEAMYYSQMPTDEMLINNWLMANYAKDQGATITAESVQSYLAAVTNGVLSNQELSQTLRDLNVNERVLIYLIQRELLAKQARDMQTIELFAATPLARWNWYNRMNRSIAAEIAVLPVEAFADKIKEPSESELKQLYEANKNRIFNPSFPESGFTLPKKIAFQAVSAIPQQSSIDAITAEEIAAFYEENKDAYFRKPMPKLPDLPTSPLDKSSGFGGFEQNKFFQLDTFKPQQENSAPAIPVPVLPITPTEEKPTEEKPEAETMGMNAVFQLVRYQSDEKPTENEVTTDSVPANVEPTESPTPSTEPVAAEPKPEEQPASESALPAAIESSLYRPLSEVESNIRQILAFQKAQKGMLELDKEMLSYFQRYARHEADSKKYSAPNPIDLEALANKHGLTFVTVPLADEFEARKNPNVSPDLLQQLYSRNVMKFKPVSVSSSYMPGMNTPEMIGWATEIEDKRTPSFEEARDAVAKRYKEIAARKIAKEKAEEFAAQAKAAGKTLKEQASGQEHIHVVETEPFVWKRADYSSFSRTRRMGTMLGNVREKQIGNEPSENQWIHAPGEEFMRTAYGLAANEFGVVMNQPETDAYVIRIVESTPSQDVLLKGFQTTSPNIYDAAGFPEMQSELFEAQMETIRKHAGFEWVKKPAAFVDEE